FSFVFFHGLLTFNTPVGDVLCAADERCQDAGAGSVESETPAIGRRQHLRVFRKHGTIKSTIAFDDSLETVAQLDQLARPGRLLYRAEAGTPGFAKADRARERVHVVSPFARRNPFAAAVGQNPRATSVSEFFGKLHLGRQRTNPVGLLVMEPAVE